MINKFSKQMMVWVALLLTAALLAACGVGGESDTIKVGAIHDLTGATSDVGTPYADGVRDYVKFVNDNGGIEGRPNNVVFYATSNRRHLMPRDMIENERSSAISPSEAVEEKVSLSDRFGLWLGFHPCTQDEYLEMIQGYCTAYGVEIDHDTLRADAIEWQATRGSRSGRVACQYFTDLAGRKGVSLLACLLANTVEAYDLGI